MAVTLSDIPPKRSQFSPFLGFAYLVWRQHSLRLSALGVYTALLAIVIHLTKLPLPVDVCSLVPIALGLVYYSMTAGGMTRGVIFNGSYYPHYLLRLPITTRALAGLPIVFGPLSIGLILLFAGWSILGPMHVDVPWIFDMIVILTALLMSIQAALWMPVAAESLRLLWFVVLGGVIVILCVGCPILIASYNLPTNLKWVGFAAMFVTAYAAGVVAVSRARRGDIIDYTWAKRTVVQSAPIWVLPKAPFALPMAAEIWYIWHCEESNWFVNNGKMLFFLLLISWSFPVALLPKFWILKWYYALAWLGYHKVPFSIRGRSWAVDRMATPFVDRMLTPFVVSRPRATSDIVASYAWAAGLSALGRWGVTLLTGCLLLLVASHATGISDTLGGLLKCQMTPHIWMMLLAGVLAYWPINWKFQLDNLYLNFMYGLWGVVLSLCGAILLIGLFVLGYVMPSFVPQFLSALPFIIAAAAILKIIAASVVLPKLVRSRLVSTRTLLKLGMIWLVIGVVITFVLTSFLSGVFASTWICISLAFLALPIVRFAFAPLALADNRHRS